MLQINNLKTSQTEKVERIISLKFHCTIIRRMIVVGAREKTWCSSILSFPMNVTRSIVFPRTDSSIKVAIAR